jgi:hypothetical protein
MPQPSGSCSSSVRVNTRGLPGDRPKGKKAALRGRSGPLRGPLPPGDAGRAAARWPAPGLSSGCVPPRLWTPPLLAGAMGGRARAPPHAPSRHGRGAPPPWRGYRAATALWSRRRWSPRALWPWGGGLGGDRARSGSTGPHPRAQAGQPPHGDQPHRGDKESRDQGQIPAGQCSNEVIFPGLQTPDMRRRLEVHGLTFTLSFL